MIFPKNDNDFKDEVITKVDAESDLGWAITHGTGWTFFVPRTSPVTPVVGMAVRLYGKGLGYRVRGLFLNGIEVFYRTEAQDDELHEIQMYGSDAADWLKRWDEGKSVWSISMGGLGPGYEQCIQITTAEMLRHFLAQNYDFDKIEADGTWEQTREEINKAVHAVPAIQQLGLSGAQYGSAMNLAGQLYRRGPRAVMNDEAVKDRHIQVEKNFPGMAAKG